MANKNTTGLRRAVSSAQFERVLFRVYPQWRSLAQYRAIQDADGVERAYLYLRVPSVNPKVSEPLSIDTFAYSVIVHWFHVLHNHFDWQTDYMQDAVKHVGDILRDEVTYSIVRPDGKSIVRSWLGGHDEN